MGPVATGICVESTFESVWCSTVKISDMKLMIVNIEYMDGTTEVIPGQMVTYTKDRKHSGTKKYGGLLHSNLCLWFL